MVRVMSLAAAARVGAASRSAWILAPAPGRWRGEALAIDAAVRHAGVEQRLFGGLDHRFGAADEDLVHAPTGSRVSISAHLVAVDAALQQIDFLRLARQDVDQRQAVRGSGPSGPAAPR
jgi:hypothetical protein